MSLRHTRRCAALAVISAVACNPQDGDRPPRADGVCSGPSCVPGVIEPADPAQGAGGAGTGGEAGAAGVESASVVVSVFELSDQAFSDAVRFPAPADVVGRAPDGDAVRVTVPALDTGTLDGVERAELLWVTVYPSLAEYLPTLNALDTTVDGPQRVNVVSAGAIDAAFAAFVPPLERTAGTAQMLLFVEDERGDPRPGVSVEHATAERVAYSAGGVFGAERGATDGSGPVLVANIPALDAPQLSGLLLRASDEVDGSEHTVSVSAAVLAGAVTLVRVRL